MLLDGVARTSADLAGTPGRTAKIERLAACLRDLRPDEVPVAAAYLSGALPQGTIGVGWAALRDLPPPAARPTLELLDVDRALDRVGAATGRGSQAARRRELSDLFGRATEPEQGYLRGLLTRRAAPGRARRADGRGGRAGRRPAGRDGPARVDAGRRDSGRRGRRARPRAPRVSRVRARASCRPLRRCCAQTADGRRETRWHGRPGRGRVQARRRADPGPPARRRRPRVHPQPRRRHRRGCRRWSRRSPRSARAR